MNDIKLHILPLITIFQYTVFSFSTPASVYQFPRQLY